MLRRSACPFGQVKTKMYLPESPFFKISLARASGIVLLSNPVFSFKIYTDIFEKKGVVYCYLHMKYEPVPRKKINYKCLSD